LAIKVPINNVERFYREAFVPGSCFESRLTWWKDVKIEMVNSRMITIIAIQS